MKIRYSVYFGGLFFLVSFIALAQTHERPSLEKIEALKAACSSTKK